MIVKKVLENDVTDRNTVVMFNDASNVVVYTANSSTILASFRSLSTSEGKSSVVPRLIGTSTAGWNMKAVKHLLYMVAMKV